MILDQLSIFIENKPGALNEVLTVMKENNINLRAMSLADTADFGILRLIVPDHAEATRILTAHGFAIKTTEVVGCKVEDVPGGLSACIAKLAEEGVNVEYVYGFASSSGTSDARIIFKVDDIKRAIEVLSPGYVREDNPVEFFW